jgi:hypothetical protein
MSSTRQTVIRGPSFTGWGNRPDFTPAHQVDLLTGIGPLGARIDASLKNPVSGREKWSGIDSLRPMADEAVLEGSTVCEAEFGLADTEFGKNATLYRFAGATAQQPL